MRRTAVVPLALAGLLTAVAVGYGAVTVGAPTRSRRPSRRPPSGGQRMWRTVRA